MGTFNTVKATLPHIRASKGSYIHVSATLHYRGLSTLPPRHFVPTTFVLGTPYQVHVSSAKAAVDALSAVLAVEEGPRGIRSNVIAPGPIANTEGMSRLAPIVPGGHDVNGTYPLGRLGDIKDIANATVFLFRWLFNDPFYLIENTRLTP
jgi:2,4-dienoyl-CoA reductase [(3E)-enoyl-CoA-producing], peroxisomal